MAEVKGWDDSIETRGWDDGDAIETRGWDDTTFAGETGKGLKAGWTGVKATPQSLQLLANSGVLRQIGDTLDTFDAIDRGEKVQQPKGFGAASLKDTYAMPYQDRPDQRAQLKEQFLRSQQNSKAFAQESLNAVRAYQTERQASVGRVPNLTDVETVKDFTDWLGFNMGSGAATMAPVMLAAVATGGIGAGLVSMAQNAAEEVGTRVEYAEGRNDPRRFRSADRAAEALAANDQNTPQYLADTAGTTAATGIVKGALDIAAGPVARAIRQRAGTEAAATSYGQIAKELPGKAGRDIAGEGLTEGAQDIASIIGEKSLGENTDDLATSAKRVLNAAAAGAAGSPFGTGVNTARDVAGVALRPDAAASPAGTAPPDGAVPPPIAPVTGAAASLPQTSDADLLARLADAGLAEIAPRTAASAVTSDEAVNLPITPVAVPNAPISANLPEGDIENDAKAADLGVSVDAVQASELEAQVDSKPSLQGNSITAEVARLRQPETGAPEPTSATSPDDPTATAGAPALIDGVYRNETSVASGQSVQAGIPLETMREEVRAMRASIDERAEEAATSPTNKRPDPTPDQINAGNYKLGHDNKTFPGLNLSIENPAGSTRSGIDKDGKAWSNTMQHHYGYLRGTKGKDKEHIDVFVNPGAPEGFAGDAFVVDQIEPTTGRFDEHKVLLGFGSIEEATAAYDSNYAADWQGRGTVTAVPMDAFKTWLKEGNTTRPFGQEQTNAAADSGIVESDFGSPGSEGIDGIRSDGLAGVSGPVADGTNAQPDASDPAAPVAGATALPALSRPDAANQTLTEDADATVPPTDQATPQALSAITEERLTALQGRSIELDVELGNTGRTGKIRMDAAEAVRDVRQRVSAARQLQGCL